jgi:hypothetical protein
MKYLAPFLPILVGRYSWRKIMVAIAVVAGALEIPVPAWSEVIYSTFGPGDTFDVNIGRSLGGPPSQINWAVAEAFTPHSKAIFTEVELAAYSDTGGDSMLVQLRDDNLGLPGSVLESLTITDLADYTEAPSGTLAVGLSILKPRLVAGNQYWITASALDGMEGVWQYSSPNVTGPTASSVDGGATWTSANSQQTAFRVDGSAVPEPSTLALIGSVAAALVSCHWQRRQGRRSKFK